MNRRGEVRLPKSDQEPLRFDQHAMVGITKPLDPVKYPFLKDKSCQAITILPKSGFSVRGGRGGFIFLPIVDGGVRLVLD